MFKLNIELGQPGLTGQIDLNHQTGGQDVLLDTDISKFISIQESQLLTNHKKIPFNMWSGWVSKLLRGSQKHIKDCPYIRKSAKIGKHQVCQLKEIYIPDLIC